MKKNKTITLKGKQHICMQDQNVRDVDGYTGNYCKILLKFAVCSTFRFIFEFILWECYSFFLFQSHNKSLPVSRDFGEKFPDSRHCEIYWVRESERLEINLNLWPIKTETERRNVKFLLRSAVVYWTECSTKTQNRSLLIGLPSKTIKWAYLITFT